MKPKPAGIVLGLIGNVVFGYGLYNLLGIGSCGGEYPPCPADAWPYFVAVPLGFIISFAGIFAGGGGIAFVGMFATVGIASILRGINGGAGPEGDTTFAYVFGGFFLLPLLLPLLVAPFLRGRTARRVARQSSHGTGTVTAVRDTGVTINDNPRVELTLSVQPEDGSAAFEATTKRTVSRLDIPRAGDRFPVWYAPDDPSDLRVGDELPGPAPSQAPPAGGQAQEWVTELGRLNDLRLSGALSDEEFSRAKDRLLAGSPPAPAGG